MVLSFLNRSTSIQTVQLKEINKGHEIPVNSYEPVKIAHYSQSLKHSARELFDIEYSRSEVECFPSKKGLFFYSLFCIIPGSHVFHHIFYSQSLESLAVIWHNHWEASLSSELVRGVKSFDEPIDLLPKDRSDALCITDAGTYYTYFIF